MQALTKITKLLSIRSLQAKFLAITIPIVLISTGVLFIVSQISFQQTATNDLEAKLKDVSNIQSISLGGPLWNVDDKQVSHILAAMVIDPEIVGAIVFDESDKIIAQVGDMAAKRETVSQITVPIKFNSKSIGKLKVAITDRLVWKATEERLKAAGVMALLLVITIVVGVLFAHRRTVGTPLHLLSESIRVSRELGVRQPVSWQSEDEMGAVVSAFNDLQDVHESDQKALIVARDNLEKRVDERTHQLSTARRRLTDAIESTSEGFAFYDAKDNLVICNSRYKELLYPGQDLTIEPGTNFEEIIRQSASTGHIIGAKENIDEWVANRIERHRSPGEPLLQQRSGGQWILISERKTSDDGTVAIYSDISDLKQRELELANKTQSLEQLSAQLAKYLSPQVYNSIFVGKQEVKLVSKRKRLTVFFSDLVAFTETTERLESEDITRLLNQYLTEMSEIALEYGATIDKYIGDAIVIFFGDPETRGVKEDAIACVKMAIDMRKRMEELEVIWRDAGLEKPLQCRIGINTGFCTVGNFGSNDRMDYTIIGSGVNLAARLEAACEPNEILISYETRAHVKEIVHCEEHDEITMKGFAEPVTTFQVVELLGSRVDGGGSIRSSSPHFQLEADVAQMSKIDRRRALAVLNELVGELSKKDRNSKDR